MTKEAIELNDPVLVARTLREIVAEKPSGYIYEPPVDASCFYGVYPNQLDYTDLRDRVVEPTGPGCLIGALLWRLGAKPDFIRTLDCTGAIDALIDGGLVKCSPQIGVALGALQNAQDHGATWEKALTEFEQRYDRAMEKVAI